MLKQQQYFDIQPYKIGKLYAESAKKLFKQICFKYQFSYQDIKLPKNSCPTPTSGTKIKGKYSSGLLSAISTKSESKIPQK